MDKKQYETPDIKVYEMSVDPNLLAGSASSDQEELTPP